MNLKRLIFKKLFPRYLPLETKTSQNLANKASFQLLFSTTLVSNPSKDTQNPQTRTHAHDHANAHAKTNHHTPGRRNEPEGVAIARNHQYLIVLA